MKRVHLNIDGKTVTAVEGEKLLWAALDNDIYIPNLCAIRNETEPAACRLCFVEVAGKEQPVAACKLEAVDGLTVNTRGEKALRLARRGFDLIMASHPEECAHCSSNRRCELQKIARHLKMSLKTRQLRKILRELPLDSSHPVLSYDPNKCVLCGRCVWVCRERLGIGVLGFTHRGFQRTVNSFSGRLADEPKCQACGECAKVCPTGALALKEGIKPQQAVANLKA
jgi:bidirectional [NiFe] hydrogenase diaphorase subunit